MKSLPIPSIKKNVREIYSECADDLTNKTAIGYIEEVVLSADAYKKYVPKDICHLPIYEIHKGDEKEIEKVYDNKFAPKKSVGRKYYDAIMANANGRCPICGGKLKQLDHFLPKSKFPLLCVTPENLVPLCIDCNFGKGKKFNPDYYSLPFNPYFDKMDEKWLQCKVTFKKDNTFVVEFINGYDKSKDINRWNKYEAHLKVYDLDETFKPKAVERLENCKSFHRGLLKKCGEEGLKESLIEERDSCEKNDVNSWSSALFRELVSKIDSYSTWLSNN